MTKKIILTGDRPTGPLHLGHYVGSLQNRVKLQDEYSQYVMIADAQALTDNFDNPEKVRTNVYEVMLDYLAVGIDPEKSSIFIQSQLPELPELMLYYLNLVSINRVGQNPTVKAEISQKSFGKSVPAGFVVYPISQAADITAFKADLVPVGEDQLPMVEQAGEIADKFNAIYNSDVLVKPKALVPEVSRLCGIDGKAKMSKSLGNGINLSEDPDSITKKVMKMYTDPDHIRVEDPGKIEGNVVFTYLDIFGRDKAAVEEMKAHYQRGGLGDVKVKRYLNDELQQFLEPIRKKREEFDKDKAHVMQLLKEGTERAREKAAKTLSEVKEAMQLNYFS